jgi:tetratricopeptide (TPR) repeat protein
MGSPTPEKLRMILARLQGVLSKCDALTARSDEFSSLAQRLDGIIKTLSAQQTEEQPLRYSDLAPDLLGVSRLFERHGFMTVARDALEIGEELKNLDIDEEAEPRPDQSEEGTTFDSTDEAPPSASRHRRRGPVSVVVALALAAVVVVLYLVQRERSTIQDMVERSRAEADAAATPLIPPTRTPPPPTQTPEPITDLGPGSPLADEIAAAHLALENGDIEEAIRHHSAAALEDIDDTQVLDTAKEIISQLMAKADGLASRGHFHAAYATLEEAKRISHRFNFSVRAIDARSRRYDAMPRFQIFTPQQTTELKESVGSRVVVSLKDGSLREGELAAVEGKVLKVHIFNEMNGGGLFYVESIPLELTAEIKVFEGEP